MRVVTRIVSLRSYRDENLYFLLSGKLWLNEPEMTWRQEMPVPSSEESKIALQSRLGLSPGKYSISTRKITYRTRVKFREVSPSLSLSLAERRFINLLSKTPESHSGESLNSDIIDFGNIPHWQIISGTADSPLLPVTCWFWLCHRNYAGLHLYLSRPGFARPYAGRFLYLETEKITKLTQFDRIFELGIRVGYEFIKYWIPSM